MATSLSTLPLLPCPRVLNFEPVEHIYVAVGREFWQNEQNKSIFLAAPHNRVGQFFGRSERSLNTVVCNIFTLIV